MIAMSFESTRMHSCALNALVQRSRALNALVQLLRTMNALMLRSRGLFKYTRTACYEYASFIKNLPKHV